MCYTIKDSFYLAGEFMADDATTQDITLDERIVKMTAEDGGANALIDEFSTFITSFAYRYGNINNLIEIDELISAAYIAFYEALGTYDITKGHFLPFASTVIKRRLMDLARKEARSDAHRLKLESSEELGGGESATVMQSAIKIFNFSEQHEMLRCEVESFKKDLHNWGIELEDLLLEAPKHKTLIQLYRQITLAVLGDEEILNTVLNKKYFPIKRISELTNTPLKKIERARKYIVATIIIASGGYEYLSEYIL